MQLLYGHDQTVAAFVAAQIGGRLASGFGPCLAHGVIDNEGRLVGGFVWTNYDPFTGTIEMSGASLTPKWMTGGVLNEAFAFVFEQIGCQMIVTQNSAENTRIHRQLARYGWDRFDIPRLMGRNEDGVVWTLTAEQWRASPLGKGREH